MQHAYSALVVKPGAGKSFRISHQAIAPYSTTLVHHSEPKGFLPAVQSSLAEERQVAWFLPRYAMGPFQRAFNAVMLLTLRREDFDGAETLWQDALREFDPDGSRLPFFHLLDIGPPEDGNVDSSIIPPPVVMVMGVIPHSTWSPDADRHPQTKALYQRGRALERIASDLGVRHQGLQCVPFDVAGALQ